MRLKVWLEVLLQRLSLSSVILFYWLTNRPFPIAQHPINPICEGQETILPRRETRKQAEWAIRLGCCVCALEEQRDSIKAVVAAVDTYSAGNAFSPAGWIETLIRNAQKVRCDKQSVQVYIKKKGKINFWLFAFAVLFFVPTRLELQREGATLRLLLSTQCSICFLGETFYRLYVRTFLTSTIVEDMTTQNGCPLSPHGHNVCARACVNVWGERGLPRPSSFKAITHPSRTHKGLITHNCRCWCQTSRTGAGQH